MLKGELEGGDSDDPTEPWSIPFKNMIFDEFLFMSGDKTRWMIMDKDEIWG